MIVKGNISKVSPSCVMAFLSKGNLDFPDKNFPDGILSNEMNKQNSTFLSCEKTDNNVRNNLAVKLAKPTSVFRIINFNFTIVAKKRYLYHRKDIFIFVSFFWINR